MVNLNTKAVQQAAFVNSNLAGNLNASPQSYAVSKKSIVPTTFSFVRKYVLHFAKCKCAFGGKFYEKRFDTTCIKPSFWCWLWDLNPHVVTNIGF